MNKNLLSQLLCTVTAQPCLCRRLLTSNAALHHLEPKPRIKQTRWWFYGQKLILWKKNLLSQLPCTVTAQPCLCSRLLTSNATLPPSLFSKIQPWIKQTNKQTNILLEIRSHSWTQQKFLNHRARLQHSPAFTAGCLQAMPPSWACTPD